MNKICLPSNEIDNRNYIIVLTMERWTNHRRTDGRKHKTIVFLNLNNDVKNNIPRVD